MYRYAFTIVILISIVGQGGTPKSYKNNGAPLSGITIVKNCGVWGEGGGGAKILQIIMAPPLSIIIIVTSK